MGDYISRQAAIEAIETMELHADVLETVRDIIAALEDMEAADVVKVVRCKDCRRRITNDLGDTWCNYHGVEMLEDDYCSYGERTEQ